MARRRRQNQNEEKLSKNWLKAKNSYSFKLKRDEIENVGVRPVFRSIWQRFSAQSTVCEFFDSPKLPKLPDVQFRQRFSGDGTQNSVQSKCGNFFESPKLLEEPPMTLIAQRLTSSLPEFRNENGEIYVETLAKRLYEQMSLTNSTISDFFPKKSDDDEDPYDFSCRTPSPIGEKNLGNFRWKKSNSPETTSNFSLLTLVNEEKFDLDHWNQEKSPLFRFNLRNEENASFFSSDDDYDDEKGWILNVFNTNSKEILENLPPRRRISLVIPEKPKPREFCDRSQFYLTNERFLFPNNNDDNIRDEFDDDETKIFDPPQTSSTFDGWRLARGKMF